MTERTIEVLVAPSGETTVQTRGYGGADCLQASRWLEHALGKVTAERRTAEFYQVSTTELRLQQ